MFKHKKNQEVGSSVWGWGSIGYNREEKGKVEICPGFDSYIPQRKYMSFPGTVNCGHLLHQ